FPGTRGATWNCLWGEGLASSLAVQGRQRLASAAPVSFAHRRERGDRRSSVAPHDNRSPWLAAAASVGFHRDAGPPLTYGGSRMQVRFDRWRSRWAGAAALLGVVAGACGGATNHRPADWNAHMVLVPAGPFTMGRDDGVDDERPAHTVWLDAFYIDRTE